MVYTKAQIKKSMDTKRRRFLKNATTPKQIMFGQDALALEFSVEYYYYMYKAWMHNYIGLSEVSYDEEYSLFTHKNDYDDMMDNLKEIYSDTKEESVKKLISLAKVLRKRYGKG